MTFPPASTDRLLHIAAFAVSGYSGTAGRTTKPFNPLLGETFEFVCQEKVRGCQCMGNAAASTCCGRCSGRMSSRRRAGCSRAHAALEGCACTQALQCACNGAFAWSWGQCAGPPGWVHGRPPPCCPVQHFCHGPTAVSAPLQGLRILAEKVVHHPTIIAGHAEGRRWTLDADSDLRSKFWGRSIELMPVGAPLASDEAQKCAGSPTS